jgi:hypothetical protein
MCGAYYREKKVVHFRFTKKVKPNAIYVICAYCIPQKLNFEMSGNFFVAGGWM